MEVNTDLLVQLGVGGIFAVLLIGKILEWLKPLVDKFTGNGKSTNESVAMKLLEELRKANTNMAGAAKQISDLHDWHNQKNVDGVFVWYLPNALSKAIVQLADNISTQTEVLRGLTTMVADQCKTSERIERRLEERDGR